MNIRPYNNSDYAKVGSWWVVQTGEVPSYDVYNEKWSWIAENEHGLIACASLILTNSPEVAHFDGIIGNPEAANRKEYVQMFLNELENKAKEAGYKKIYTMAENNKMKKYYQDKKFNVIKDGLCLLGKDL